jgi:thioredoxin-like negative regulator of GroEL
MSSLPMQVVSVNVGEGADHVREHYARRSVGRIRVLVDESGAVAKRFGVEALPTLVLVDARGTVRLIHAGAPQDLKPLRLQIEKVSK